MHYCLLHNIVHTPLLLISYCRGYSEFLVRNRLLETQTNMQVLLEHLLAKAKKDIISRFVVGGIVGWNNKVLCLKRMSNDFMPRIYELPSGKVEAEESLSEALIREVKEETNLNITQICDYLGYFDYQSRSGNKTRQFNFMVDCDVATSKVQLDTKEHEGYSWISRDEIDNYNITDNIKIFLKAYFLKATTKIQSLSLITEAIKSNIERFVVGSVIHHDDRILCLKRASNDFMGGIDELPSGKVEQGEPLEYALLREVKEETGLQIGTIDSYLGHFDYKSKSGVNTRQFNFSVTPIAVSPVTLSQEHEGFAWITSHELQRYSLSEEVKIIVKNYFDKVAQELLPTIVIENTEVSKKRKIKEVTKSKEKAKAKKAKL